MDAYNRPTSRGARPLFLKSISISGFKSFARNTNIDLPAGITALVGANGSGKSNVVDAVRWCLGEQSIRELRGQRAEDVIYAGARHSLGRAEVEITLERNDSEAGPAETSIARRLYRSGQSEYLVDGVRVRLRDVQDTLRAIGVDGGRYVIVTQGMTDAWVSATPAERRALLEQAAGLAGYRVRRDEARQKLATTAQNVQLIETVLAELEPRLRILRRQAKAVQDRADAQLRLRQLLEQWYGWHWQSVSRRIQDLRAQSGRLSSKRGEATGSLHNLETEAERQQLEARSHRQHREMVLAALHAAQREYDAASFSLREARSQVSSAGTLLADMTEQRESAEAALAGHQRRVDAAAADLAETRQQEVEMRNRVDALQAELSVMQAREEANRDEVRRRQHALEAATNKANELRLRIESERRRGQVAGQEQAEALTKLIELEFKRGRADANIATATAELASAANLLQESTAESRAADARVEAVKDRQRRLERLTARLRARSSDEERRLAHIDRLLAGLMADPNGQFANALRVREGWELAVAAALGTWVAPSDQSNSGSSENLAATATQARHFLCWRQTLDEFCDTGLWADAVVDEMPTTFVHPLLGTLFVATEREGRELWERIAMLPAHLIGSPPVRVVTREGTVFSALGSETGAESEGTSRVLVANRDRQRSQRSLSHVHRWLERIIAMSDATRDELAEVSAVASRAGERESVSIHEVAVGRERLQQAELEVRRVDEEAMRWELRRESAERQSAESAATAHAVERELDDALGEVRRSEDTQREAGSRLDTEGDLPERRERLRVETARLDAMAVAVRAHASLHEATRAEVTRQEQALRALAQRTDAAQLDLERSSERVDAATVRVEQLRTVLDQQRVRVDELGAAPPESIIDRDQLQQARRQVAQLVAESEHVDAMLGAIEAERDRILADLAVDLQSTVSALPRDVPAIPDENEIRRLRQRAAQYADSNVEVIQERDELEERYAQLRDHLADLESASDTLEGIMAHADDEMRTRFESAFRAVNDEFNRVFGVMLPAGWAQLEIVDGDGGVGIRAQLPGKRTQSAAGFSGGERALLASSLLFGVLKIRPAPFCILDEVDAALDESNVERYLAALRDISSKTQILVVTHNRATMAAANVLYGVTLSDEGVSGLLSVRLDAYQTAG